MDTYEKDFETAAMRGSPIFDKSIRRKRKVSRVTHMEILKIGLGKICKNIRGSP